MAVADIQRDQPSQGFLSGLGEGWILFPRYCSHTIYTGLPGAKYSEKLIYNVGVIHL
jgi:hypothetical protein